MAALVNFNKELSRFTLKYKTELFNDIMSVIENGDDVREYLENSLETVGADLLALDKKTKGSKRGQGDRKVKGPPRPLSAYNKFIKKVLPEIAQQNPDMDNKTRMSKASEKWKTLTDKQKEEYKNMEV